MMNSTEFSDRYENLFELLLVNDSSSSSSTPSPSLLLSTSFPLLDLDDLDRGDGNDSSILLSSSSSSSPSHPPLYYDNGTFVTSTASNNEGGGGGVELNWWALLTFIVPLLAVFGNLLVVLAVRNEPRLQTRTNSFLLSLAVCDSLVAILVIPPSCLALFTGNWRLGGGVGCLVWLFLDVFFCTASILHLTILSIDRWLSLRFPWRFGREKSRSRLMLTILFVWFASVSLALFLPISLCLKYSQVQDSVLVEGHCVIPDPAYRVWASLVCFYLPLLVMVATYALTVRLLRKHPLRMPERNYSIPLKRRLQRGETNFGPCPEVFGQQVSTETDSSSFSCELCEENSGRLKRKRTATTTSWKCRGGGIREHDRGGSGSGGGSGGGGGGGGGETGNHHAMIPLVSGGGGGGGIGCGGAASTGPTTTTNTTNAKMFKEVVVSGGGGCGGGVGGGGRDGGTKPPNNICKVKTKTASISLTNFDYQIPASRTSSSNTTKYWENENVSRASWRLLARLSKNASNRRILRSERKATKVLGVVFFAFVGLWLPFFALNVTAALWPVYGNDQVMEGATWIGWTSSLINPFLYTAFNRDFRNAFSRLLRCKCRKQPPVRL